jgi:hypothetical protein
MPVQKYVPSYLTKFNPMCFNDVYFKEYANNNNNNNNNARNQICISELSKGPHYQNEICAHLGA